MSAREKRLRQQVEALQAALRRAELMARGGHMDNPMPHPCALGRAYSNGLRHELDTATGLASAMAADLAPRTAPKPALPAVTSVAWAVLEALEVNRRTHDHDHLRMLAGLTDAQLVVCISGAGANSVRPRRIDLTRRGLIEQVPGTSPARWRLSTLALELLGADRAR